MIREEVEGFDLSKEKNSLVKEFIAFLNKENVEIRLYDNEAMDFKAGLIELLDASRFGSKEYTPYDVYIKALFELPSDKSKKFVSSIIREIDLRLDDYILDFPEDKEIEKRWEETKERLLAVSLTKKRLQCLRAAWRNYKVCELWF